MVHDPTVAGAARTDTRDRDRLRLIDHFKRVYSIIAGLAITEACKKLWPFSWDSFSDYRVWMFAAFFVTIVPIFHGGDRSLDHKYADSDSTPPGRRAAYIWDVYMLLLTAILFVGLAEAIPSRSENCADPKPFYTFFASLLGFDVFVLCVDFFKSSQGTRQKLESYPIWIAANLMLSVFCLFAVGILVTNPSLSVTSVGVCVFIASAFRTFADYAFSDEFMFP